MYECVCELDTEKQEHMVASVLCIYKVRVMSTQTYISNMAYLTLGCAHKSRISNKHRLKSPCPQYSQVILSVFSKYTICVKINPRSFLQASFSYVLNLLFTYKKC